MFSVPFKAVAPSAKTHLKLNQLKTVSIQALCCGYVLTGIHGSSASPRSNYVIEVYKRRGGIKVPRPQRSAIALIY